MDFVGLGLRGGGEGAGEAEAVFFEDAAGRVVAGEDLGAEFGQGEGAEGVGDDEAGGGGAEALVPVGAGDDEADLGRLGGVGGEGETDGADALALAGGDDGPADGGFPAEAFAVAVQPGVALGDRGWDRVAGEGGGFGVCRAGEPGGDVGFVQRAEMEAGGIGGIGPGVRFGRVYGSFGFA